MMKNEGGEGQKLRKNWWRVDVLISGDIREERSLRQNKRNSWMSPNDIT